MIGPLTDPTAHGGWADDGIHLIIPSLPGFTWFDKSIGRVFNAGRRERPKAATVFPREQFQPLRAWAEALWPDLIYWGEAAHGGHFAAFEQPAIFTQELRQAFRSVRHT